MVSNGTDNMVMPVAPMYGSGYNGGSGCNGWGGDWAWIILLLLLAGNGWGNGFGGGSNGGNGVMPYLWNTQTQNDVNRGFDNAGISGQLSGIQTAITTGFANAEVSGCNRVIDSMNQRFADTQAITAGLTNISSQLANCCCENRLATANLGADIAREACATRTSDAQNTQAILGAINGGIQSIKDQLCQDKIDAKNDEIAQLRQEALYARGQASQIAQNQQIVDAIYNRLDTCPVGTTPVYGRTPIFTCNNNCGCGCG
ncbi:MAG: hypothetical protein J6Y02_20715 [Pseudobutyrivibrio sp.]|nr:hypothetical protein [Pseudobutyrivibrio sp.]